MFWEVIEIKYDSDSNPERIEKTIGRFRNSMRAFYSASDWFYENKPEGFTIVAQDVWYRECILIAEKLNNSKRVQRYMIEAREVEFDD